MNTIVTLLTNNKIGLLYPVYSVIPYILMLPLKSMSVYVNLIYTILYLNHFIFIILLYTYIFVYTFFIISFTIIHLYTISYIPYTNNMNGRSNNDSFVQGYLSTHFKHVPVIRMYPLNLQTTLQPFISDNENAASTTTSRTDYLVRRSTHQY